MLKIEKITKRVLEKVKPTKEEILAEKEMARKIITKIKSIEGKHIDVIVAGSSARGTHLRGDRDIDIFVLFPENTENDVFVQEGLRIGKMVFRGHEWEEAYSQHPYIRGNISGFDIEIVPSYKISKTEMLKSAVDRTPFHMEYLERKFKEKQRDEVRILRQFFKGIGCYGADLKYSSVPGYVIELLIVKYGNFENALKAISEWKDKEVIDLENYHLPEDAVKKFNWHLIVVDPVDRNRNVAAALSLNQYSRIIAAARAFLKKPSINFFLPKKCRILEAKKLSSIVKKKELIALQIAYPQGILPDIVWGQIKRIANKIATEMHQVGFAINRYEAWTDEKENMFVVFELEATKLQKSLKRIGPLVTDSENSSRFLGAHKKLIAGPRIENGRWVLEITRKHYDAFEFLHGMIKKLRVSEKTDIRKALRKKAFILREAQIVSEFKKNREFAEFLSKYLRGKEAF